MSRFLPSLRSLALIATTLAAAAMAAPPQDPLSMQITGPKPRFDVDALCPEIHQQLPDALAQAWHDIPLSGTVEVLLTVKGNYVQRVETLDGPVPLQRAVRRAARWNVVCRTTESTPQMVFFRVHFVDWPTSTSRHTGALANVSVASQ